jgi:thiol-disulfide isomerase/thioredoxin
MIFLHINSKSNNASLFNQYIEEGKQIFVIFYMEGCGPCNMTRPEWKKIENILSSTDTNNNIVVVDIDQEVLEELKYLQSKPIGFPTMRYIANKGKTSEDYNGERNIDAFMKWIQSKSSTFKKSTFKKSYAKRRPKISNTLSTFKKSTFKKSTFKKSGAKNNSNFKKSGAKNNSNFKKRRAKNNSTLKKSTFKKRMSNKKLIK